MERCIFCGSTRKSAPNLRFFGVPKEPGLKRIQWLYILGDREIAPKDRVCALHFRQGKPSGDPSHEDFVPHLRLTKKSTDEKDTLEYLESLDDIKEIQRKNGTRSVPKILQKKQAIIVQRDKKANSLTINANETNTSVSVQPQHIRIPIPDNLSNAIQLEQGQKVIIKRYKLVNKRV